MTKKALRPGQRKVALVESYVFDRDYGNQKYIRGLFKYLDSDRYTMILVAPMEGEFTRSLRELGAKVEAVRQPARLRRFGGALLSRNPFGLLATVWALLVYNFRVTALLRREGVSAVQVNNLRSLLAGGLAAKCLGLPLLWYVKGHLDNPLLDRLGFRLADCVMFQSEANMRRRYPDLLARYAGKIRIVSNGLDLEEIGRVETPSRQPDGIVRIGYLGQISPLKGVHVLLEAMERVARDCPNTRLLLVGDHCSPEFTAYVSELQKRLAERRLDNVEFCGYRPDALKLLATMDLYVLPSLSEGTPRSIMEAMALGKPVVATRVGGIPELVVDGETGYVVPADDAVSLAEALIKLCTDAGQRARFGQHGRERIFRNFSFNRNTEMLMDALDACLYEKAGLSGRGMLDHGP